MANSAFNEEEFEIVVEADIITPSGIMVAAIGEMVVTEESVFMEVEFNAPTKKAEKEAKELLLFEARERYDERDFSDIVEVSA